MTEIVESHIKAQTRIAILESAESVFAHKGFQAARLEDVGEAVGLSRAALFYYFRDKRTLYVATLENSFGSLTSRLDEALAIPGPISKRIERAVEAWVDTTVERPALARLILRFAADSVERPEWIYPSNERLLRTFWSLFEEGAASGELNPIDEHPYHSASSIVGSTVFYVCAMSALMPFEDFQPLEPDQVANHKRNVLQIVRRMLGMKPPKKTASGGKARRLVPTPIQ